MLLTPHTFVGAAIAVAVPNPLIAVPLAFVSHFVGDLVPHWDFYSGTLPAERIKGWRPIAVMADLVFGVATGMTFTLYGLWVQDSSSLALNFFLCGIAAVLPDALCATTLYGKSFKSLKWLYSLQEKLQIQAKLPWGIITQIIVVLVSFLVISNLRGQ